MKPAWSRLPVFTCATALLVLASPLRLEADPVLKNSDFSDGINHWNGDGQDVAKIAPDQASQGMILELHPSAWTKAYL
jgi:hypothetical protein